MDKFGLNYSDIFIAETISSVASNFADNAVNGNDATVVTNDNVGCKITLMACNIDVVEIGIAGTASLQDRVLSLHLEDATPSLEDLLSIRERVLS